MKKIYLTVTAIAVATLGFAQNARVSTHASANLHSMNASANKIIHNNSTQAAGDTVWIFDGLYTYDWNMTLPATYSVALEDVDGLTISPTYTPYFGTTGSFKIFYDTNAAAVNLHYGHPDTVFFVAGTSWFATAATASNWIEFGPIHVPAGGGTLKWMHNLPDASYRDGYEVLVNTTGLSHTNYTNAPVFSVGDNATATAGDTATTPHYQWYSRSASVSTYAGQDIYVAFHHNAHDMDVLQLTNVMLIEAGTTNINNQMSNGFFVGNNVPNPANGSTTVSYSVAKSSTVAFNVTDLTGKVVYTENVGEVAAGAHTVNLSTASLSNGMYLYTFVINGHKETRKFVVANN